MITKNNVKFYMFIAWPLLAGVIAAMLAICFLVSLAFLAVAWPLIPFMRVAEGVTGKWTFTLPWSA